MSEKQTGLALLREPFPAHQISKLPKPTKKQTDDVKADFKKGIRCTICGAWHHPDAVHLDYVGHAALTDRLLDADPTWQWEPLAMADTGLPVMDGMGGMWIRLTVCGVSRLGYGHAGDKQGGDAIKEVIGDALRNAAMRFGAALDLWHKGDLHIDDPEPKARKVAGIPDNVRATPTDGAGDGLDAQARSECEELAAYLVECHESGNDITAIGVWYAVETWPDDVGEKQERQKYVWHLLKSESKLRGILKANKPVEVPA